MSIKTPPAHFILLGTPTHVVVARASAQFPEQNRKKEHLREIPPFASHPPLNLICVTMTEPILCHTQYATDQQHLLNMPKKSTRQTLRLQRAILETYLQLDKLTRLKPRKYDRAIHILEFLEAEITGLSFPDTYIIPPPQEHHYTAQQVQDTVGRVKKALLGLVTVDGNAKKRKHIRLLEFVQKQIECFKLLPEKNAAQKHNVDDDLVTTTQD